MAIGLEIIEGSDRGWSFVLMGQDVRIGKGAGHHVPITDPGWGTGTLRVLKKAGGYLMRNELPHAVFLDGRAVGAGESRTLHAGAVVQPTAGTLFRVVMVEPPSGAAAEGAVAVPPAAPRRDHKMTLLCLLILLGAGYWWSEQQTRKKAEQQFLQRTEQVKAELQSLCQTHERQPLVAQRLKLLQSDLTEAIYEDSVGSRHSAAQRYLVARDRIATISTRGWEPDDVQRMTVVNALIQDRMIATGR